MKCRVFLVVPVSIAAVSGSFAQTITGSVSGTVSDASGAVVPNATITVTNVQTNVSAKTQTAGDGVYNVRFLQVGQYKVTAEAAGFQPQTLGPFSLEAGQDAKFDAKLGVTGSQQSVDVTSSLTPLLNTENGELGTTLDTHAIDNTPLVGRNFSSLTIYTAGAVATNPTSLTDANAIERSTNGGGQASINGNRQQANNFLLDGIEINETINNTIGYNPSPDALDQVRVISANAQAEYGNVNGGDIVTLTKSGTNSFHGYGFYYVNDDSFTANTWANNLNRIAKSSFTSNIFGGGIGGPILRDKLFFFGDYSGNRYHLGGPATSSVATARMRTGDFGELLDTNLISSRIQLYNSLTPGAPAYANNRLPATAISPAARFLFAHPELYPLPNKAAVAGTVISGNYVGASKKRIYNDQFDVKIDYHFRDKDQFFVRYSQSTAGDSNTNPIAITFPTASSYPTKGVAINYVRTFNPHIQNEARVGFFRTVWHQGLPVDSTGAFGLNGNATLGIGIVNTVPGFTAQVFNGAIGTTLGNSAIYSDNAMNNFTYADNLTVQRGAHVIKMGAQFIRYQQNSIYTGNDGAQGQMQYSGNFTARNGAGTAPPAGVRDVGYDYADFYLDRVFYAGRGTLAGHTGQRQWRDAIFVQDDWKVSPTLTVNLGLRWEYDQPIYEVNNKQANLNLATGAIQLAGVNGNSRALYNPVWTNFMPRIGFSYNPTQRVVVRGGFGTTTYLEGTGANLRLTINPPFQTSLSYSASAPTATSTGTSVTAATAFASNTSCDTLTNPLCGGLFRAWDPNLRPSTVTEYSLTTEYQLNNSSSFQVGYVGEYGYHLIQAVNANQVFSPCVINGTAVAYNTAACFAVNKAPYYQLVGQSGRVAKTASQSMFNYNALQATFRQRLRHGLQFTANYAYSRSLTNSLGFYGVSGINQNSAYAEDPRNNTQEYGPAGTDTPHNLNFTMNYELPVGRGHAIGGNVNRFIDDIIGGWRVGVAGFVYAGFPTTITAQINSAVNAGQQRALRYRKLRAVNRSTNNWFGTDPSAAPCTTAGVDNGSCAYGQPAAGVISPQRPNTERVPSFQQYDASAFKDFHIREGMSFTLRCDASNVFNIASYGNPDRTITSSTFGRITTTRSGPRTLQLAAKFSF